MRSHDQMWMLSEVAYLPSHSLAGGSPQEPHGENTKNNLGPRALPWDCDIGGVLWDKHAPPRRSVGASRFGVVQEWGSPDALPLPRFVLVRVEPLVFETLGPFRAVLARGRRRGRWGAATAQMADERRSMWTSVWTWPLAGGWWWSYLIENIGGRAQTRTGDLLRVNSDDQGAWGRMLLNSGVRRLGEGAPRRMGAHRMVTFLPLKTQEEHWATQPCHRQREAPRQASRARRPSPASLSGRSSFRWKSLGTLPCPPLWCVGPATVVIAPGVGPALPGRQREASGRSRLIHDRLIGESLELSTI